MKREIHKIRQVCGLRVAAAHVRRKDYQLAQNGILQLEFDAVDKCLERDVDVEEAGVLDSDHCGVHHDHGQVDDQELDQGAAVVASWAEIQ